MIKSISILTCLCCSLLAIASSQEAKASPNNLELSLALLKNSPASKENVCLSPFSIEEAFALANLGAKGDTTKEISKLFQFPSSGVPDRLSKLQKLLEAEAKAQHIRFSLANSLFVDKEFELLDSYLDAASSLLHAEPEKMDFREHPEDSRQAINSWVEDQTKNKIHELLKKGNVYPETLLVIVNAVYLQANWLDEFDKSLSAEKDFFVSSEKSEKVFFMNKSADLVYGESSTYSLLSIPYQGEKLSLFLLLPKERTGLEKILNSLSASQLEQGFAAMKIEEVDLSLPRFKISYDLSLVQMLKDLGLESAFRFPKADFSGIDGTRRLFISEVRHQAVIEVDEKGTEAAAATAIAMADGAAENPEPRKVFIADHPFLFFLRENGSGNILFVGSVQHP